MIQPSTHSAPAFICSPFWDCLLCLFYHFHFPKQMGVNCLAIVVSPHCPPASPTPHLYVMQNWWILGVCSSMISQRYSRHPWPCSISGIKFILRLFIHLTVNVYTCRDQQFRVHFKSREQDKSRTRELRASK